MIAPTVERARTNRRAMAGPLMRRRRKASTAPTTVAGGACGVRAGAEFLS